MTETTRKLINDENVTDEKLVLVAMKAVRQKDNELLEKLKNLPNADWKTICVSIMNC